MRKSVIVARPAEAMFALVAECERYPEFLPWCAGVVVHERTAGQVLASLEIDYHGLRSNLSTRNTLAPPGSIDLEFGPMIGHIMETLVDRFVERAQSAPGEANGALR